MDALSRNHVMPFPPLRWIASLACAVGTLFLVTSCSKHSKVTGPEATTVIGRVVYADDASRGVPDVLVRAVGKNALANTDSTGWFALSVTAEDNEFLQLTLSKPGFDAATASLTVQAGAPNQLPAAVALARTGAGTSGPANTIVLKSASAFSIGVPHGGDSENATLVFEVLDASARPVDFSHRASIRFTLYQMTGGGARLSPDTVSTDSNGLAAATLTSGTLAQAVQIRAEVTGTAIHSEPVRVAIHGGLPNANHFSFGVERINFPGLDSLGATVKVTAYVGDRYSNPVQTGTAVYFSTTGGIIQGSAPTDDLGRSTVTLVSAAPFPNAVPALSDSAGIARITVQTMGENQTPLVLSSRAVMFSGHTSLSVTPTAFAVPLDGYQDFTITLWDTEHHNPLTGGTTIKVTATAGKLGADASVTLPDTWDPRYTHFTFRLNDPATGALVLVAPDGREVALRPVTHASKLSTAAAAAPNVVQALTPTTVTVEVKSPNGDMSFSLYGTVETP